MREREVAALRICAGMTIAFSPRAQELGYDLSDRRRDFWFNRQNEGSGNGVNRGGLPA